MTADLLILHTPYSIKAFVGDRLRAQATRAAWGWHVPLQPRTERRKRCGYCGDRHPDRPRQFVAWQAVQSRAEAVALVSRLAVRGAA